MSVQGHVILGGKIAAVRYGVYGMENDNFESTGNSFKFKKLNKRN